MKKNLTVFGIKTCSTVTKFIKALKENGYAVEFYDYLAQSIDQETLIAQVKDLGWGSVINLKARNFTSLPEEEKAYLKEIIEKAPEFDEKAFNIIKKQPRMIKRPIVFDGKKYVIIPKLEDVDTLFPKR